MRRSGSWLFLLILFGAFAAAVYLGLRAQANAGKGMPPYSVYSSDSEKGLAQAGQVLRKLGFRPYALTRPVSPDQNFGLLILVEPQTDTLLGKKPGMTRGEAHILLKWVEEGGTEEGNTLVLCGRTSTPLHLELRVAIHGDEKAAEQGMVRGV